VGRNEALIAANIGATVCWCRTLLVLHPTILEADIRVAWLGAVRSLKAGVYVCQVRTWSWIGAFCVGPWCMLYGATWAALFQFLSCMPALACFSLSSLVYTSPCNNHDDVDALLFALWRTCSMDRWCTVQLNNGRYVAGSANELLAKHVPNTSALQESRLLCCEGPQGSRVRGIGQNISRVRVVCCVQDVSCGTTWGVHDPGGLPA
jgi:hypothetical protein